MKLYLMFKKITYSNRIKYVVSPYIKRAEKVLFSENRNDAQVFTEKQVFEFQKKNPNRKLELEEFESVQAGADYNGEE